MRTDVPPRPAETVAAGAPRIAVPATVVNIALGAVLAIVSWPGTAAALAPTDGLDPSWQAALAMAAHHRLDFGTDIIWTYGPFGFLVSRALYYPIPAALALAYHFATAAAAFVVLVAAVRRSTSLPIAVVVAYVAGYPLVVVWGGSEVLLVLALVLTVRVLSRGSAANGAIGLWLGFGALTAFTALEKLSLGAGIAALTIVALTCAAVPDRLHAVALTAGSAVLVFVAGWFGTGNGFGNLLPYVRAAREAATGYTAMAIDPTSGHYVGLAVVTGGALVVATVLYARALRRPGPDDAGDTPAPVTRRAAAGLVVAVAFVLWVLFKEGFVRQDTHRLVFFASLPLIVAALALGPSAARPVPPARVVALLLVASFVAFAVYGAMPSGIVDPVANTRGFVGTVRALVLPDRRANVVNAARANLQAAYAVPASMVERIGDDTVDVQPWEQTVAWAYPQWQWDPLPTLQHYFAYTDALDDRDADVVASDTAPRFVLRRPPASIDGRRAAFDAPATQIAIVCHYGEAEAGTHWQLLERGGQRCGPERELGSREIRFGESVDVPAAGPNEMVVARFDLHLPWWWRVADLAYKAPQVHIRVDDAAQPNRFVVGTAGQPHLLVPASTSGFAARFDEPPIGRLALEVAGGAPSGSSATVTFAAIPVEPADR